MLGLAIHIHYHSHAPLKPQIQILSTLQITIMFHCLRDLKYLLTEMLLVFVIEALYNTSPILSETL